MDVWPLAPLGELPSELFPADYLHALFFENASRIWKLDAKTLRRGLKYFLKKNDSGLLEAIPVSGSQIDRDTALVKAICQSGPLRQKFPSIEFQAPNRKAPLKPTEFASFLLRFGLRLSPDPEVVGLCKWLSGADPTRPSLSDLKSLNAQSFEMALNASTPPLPLEHIAMARAFVIRAALMGPGEGADLLRTALRLGVGIPDRLNPDETAPEAKYRPADHVSAAQSAAPPAEAEAIDALPRIGDVGLSSLTPPEVNGDLARRHVALTERLAACEARATTAQARFGPGLETLVRGPAGQFDDAITELKAWHSEENARVAAQHDLDEKLESVRSTLERRIGLAVEPLAPKATFETVELVGQAEWAASFYDPQFDDVADWRSTLPDPAPLSRILELADLHARREATARADKLFEDALIERLPNRSAALIEDWLPRLSARELVHLVNRSADLGGPVQRSLLIAYGVERHGSTFAEQIAQKVLPGLEAEARRSSLRFIQKSSAKLDGAPTFRRFVCREHFAAILLEGPLAQIADVSVGSTEILVAGRRLAQVVDTVIANLDIVSSAADIRRRLEMAQKAGDNTAARGAVTFIQTPAGMSGHFWRLREFARENYLLPLVAGGSLNIRHARDLLRGLTSGEVEQTVFDDVDRSLAGSDKLESQHRLQLNRYLQSAIKHLEGAVKAETGKVEARMEDFAYRLDEGLRGLAVDGAPGSIEWLEAEFSRLLNTERNALESQACLIGSEETIAERRWTKADEDWRNPDFGSVEFYRSHAATLWSVLNALTAYGAQDREEIVDLLLAEQNFNGALRAAIEAGKFSTTYRHLRKRVEEAASPFLRATRQRLDDLERAHGRDLLRTAEAYQPLKEALLSLTVQDAEAFITLLEEELDERQEQTERDQAAAQERIASADLQTRLLRAGDQGAPESSLGALRQRWDNVLESASGRRAHLTMVTDITKTISSDAPEFAPVLPLIAELKARSEDPDWWLPGDKAAELVEYLTGTVEKIGRWIDVAGILTPDVRRDLSALLSAFLTFLYDRTVALRTASADGEAESVFESVIEFELTATAETTPLDCLRALAKAGLIQDSQISTENRQNGLQIVPGRRQADDFAKSVANAVAAKAWQELYQLAANARPGVAEDEVQRTDDIADFGQVMTRLTQNDRAGAYDLLDGAARAISTSGHPIHRAFSARDRNILVIRLLRCALDPAPSIAKRPDFRTWPDLLAAYPGVFKAEDAAPAQLTRVLSIVFGAQAFELADQAWLGATGMSDLTAIRSDLLIYLHDQGQADTIVRLCARHDPAIKGKMEQMLELRTAAIGRPSLIPVAEGLGEQIHKTSKSAAFRNFIRRLPTAVQGGQGSMRVEMPDPLIVRSGPYNRQTIKVSVTVVPETIVFSQLQVNLVAEDDVTFEGRSGRVMKISDDLLYAPKDFVIDLTLGDSWDDRIRDCKGSAFRLRFSAMALNDSIVTADLEVAVTTATSDPTGRSIDTETLLEYYPGVGNTPAVGDAFVGRTESLEQLHNFLVAARQPSPILLTGMRRVGKTSLLQEFHRRHRKAANSQPITVYLSIAELRQQLMSRETTVSATLYRAIGRAISKREFSATDHNRDLGERLKQNAAESWGSMRALVQESYDSDSLADSLMLLTDRVLETTGAHASRLIVLLDEAEALIYPYSMGGEKKVELEQLLQSLREVSQASDRFGMVLSGSNHITAFAKEYKNAFFGSCVDIELEGLTSVEDASRLIAPARVEPFVQFEPSAVKYGVELCAGMPQFMWQLGAATVYAVRSGKALRSDVRSAVSALVDGDHTKLPFKSYDVLEPIEHMLSPQGDREQDLLWLLLRRVAQTSSLTALHASWHLLIESELLELDSKPSWNKRLQTLVDLKILTVEANNSYRFKVPLFAEGFRAARADFDAEKRMRRLST